jgi:hypothetical protein
VIGRRSGPVCASRVTLTPADMIGCDVDTTELGVELVPGVGIPISLQASLLSRNPPLSVWLLRALLGTAPAAAPAKGPFVDQSCNLRHRRDIGRFHRPPREGVARGLRALDTRPRSKMCARRSARATTSSCRCCSLKRKSIGGARKSTNTAATCSRSGICRRYGLSPVRDLIKRIILNGQRIALGSSAKDGRSLHGFSLRVRSPRHPGPRLAIRQRLNARKRNDRASHYGG